MTFFTLSLSIYLRKGFPMPASRISLAKPNKRKQKANYHQSKRWRMCARGAADF